MTLKTFIWLIYDSKLTQKTKDHKVKIGMEKQKKLKKVAMATIEDFKCVQSFSLNKS
jgi:hypothetical protein